MFPVFSVLIFFLIICVSSFVMSLLFCKLNFLTDYFVMNILVQSLYAREMFCLWTAQFFASLRPHYYMSPAFSQWEVSEYWINNVCFVPYFAGISFFFTCKFCDTFKVINSQCINHNVVPVSWWHHYQRQCTSIHTTSTVVMNSTI